MTQDDFIAEVAKRLEWAEEKTTSIIETILEVVSAELKVNNPVIIDDFGTLKTNIQPEYILVNPETKERYLMPPVVEIVFDALFQNDVENSLLRACFTPDETLYHDVNSFFSLFEPTPLNEGVQFPGIFEIVAEEPEPEITDSSEIIEPSELIGQTEHTGQMESVKHHVTVRTIETPVQAEPSRRNLSERKELAGLGQSLPQCRFRRGLKSNKRISSVWIPIVGGIAIILVSLFFKGGYKQVKRRR